MDEFYKKHPLSMKVLNWLGGSNFGSPLHSFDWPLKGEVVLANCSAYEGEGKDRVHGYEQGFNVRDSWWRCHCGIHTSPDINFLKEYGYQKAGSVCFVMALYGKVQCWVGDSDMPLSYAVRSEGVKIVAVEATAEDLWRPSQQFEAITSFGVPSAPAKMIHEWIKETWLQSDFGFDPYDLKTWKKYKDNEELLWKAGNGRRMYVSQMVDEHLLNSIYYLCRNDVSVSDERLKILMAEAKKRKLDLDEARINSEPPPF